ncbi:MAG: hypothetical protein U9R75_11760 [Candidatus Thermoplasmatota archaeon]|nr:hypothetical protein [Candidatus Thermoplasmatota archaeon]
MKENRSGATVIVILALLLLTLLVMDDSPMVRGHPAQSVELQYYYSDQILNVTITHQIISTEMDIHYIEEVTVSKNGVEIIDETYADQPTRDTFSYEYEVQALDGDVLEVYTRCSIGGEETAEMTVIGPRDRMSISVQPDTINYLEMGEEQDFTLLIEKQDDSTPIEGATLTTRADLGEVTDVLDLGIGAYQFTYTAPEQDNEDIEVINITATKNGFHNAYFEFSFDITYPLDPDFVLVVDITPVTLTMKEDETRDLTVLVSTESGDPVDIDELILTRSGGQVSQEKREKGEFLVTFRANQVSSDTIGFLAVTAEKEGYQRGYRKVQISIKDVPSADDDDDGVTDTTDEGGLLSGYNLIFFIALISIIVAIVAFIFYRKWKNRKMDEEMNDPMAIQR